MSARQTPRITAAVVAVIVAGAVLLLTGCMKEKPIVSTPTRTTSATLSEQSQWVAERFDAGIAASEVREGWVDPYSDEVLWSPDRPEDRERMMGAWLPDGCGGLGGALNESLHNSSYADPPAAAARVKAFWEQQAGATVRDMYPGSQYNDIEPHFIVDFDEGGWFSMRARADMMSISAVTACSTHTTVTKWTR